MSWLQTDIWTQRSDPRYTCLGPIKIAYKMHALKMAKTVPNNSFETSILRFTWTTLPHTRCSVLWQIMPKPMDYVSSRGEVAAVATGSTRYYTPRLPSHLWNQTLQEVQMLSLLIEGIQDICHFCSTDKMFGLILLHTKVHKARQNGFGVKTA